MSRRPPNEQESNLHQAALAAPKNELSAKQVEAIIPDPAIRQKALNFLLGVGLLKSLSDKKGNLTFRAVTKTELNTTKDLSAEENLVLGHIKASSNEGIWTKHLKAKTNLHQTVIDRCLKTLGQKKLIKRVPSVQHPTRKIFMLEGIEPSIALTGGPWYTDNELDTEFIETLIKACLKFIRDMTFPKQRHHPDGALYPISNSPEYPTAQQVRNTLRQARLTETELSVVHVEMLLNVLILDGEIEKIPAFGASLWDNNLDDSDADESKSKKKRKHTSSDSDHARKRRRTSDDDTSSKSKKKRKHSSDTADESESDTHSRKRKKKKKKHARHSSSDDSSSSESESDRKPSVSPAPQFSLDDIEGVPAFVYRAIRQERLSLGWSQSPCSICPSFDFCKDGGPVNPKECIYYGDWLQGGLVADIADIED